jgi:hypothetical protein
MAGRKVVRNGGKEYGAKWREESFIIVRHLRFPFHHFHYRPTSTFAAIGYPSTQQH